MPPVPVRDAATVILLRDGPEGPAVLVGRRGARAAFMPSKYVFPGGALDAGDAGLPLPAPDPGVSAVLGRQAGALCACAIRELWEETGQIIGRPGDWPDAPAGWRGFAATGHRPDPAALELVFRAVTPAGQPRRFDARFFVARAERLASDPDDFSRAEDELAHLHWAPMSRLDRLDLPEITRLALAELAARRADPDPGRPVPYFHGTRQAPMPPA
ncbi:NUDIX hydrolase [Limimaricola pyoseonensis]|uniref:NUDIX domain-containing protein n=1 Tax=Limimaricola pyoseonensis TaxID=521013 RepID=A0A1G7CTW8_9RHOB|nr:NUDIX domain-containing protein [Limimaricola pyoseonensis]SDE42802.1 NUDIX domain-containing protein [Limimaricola pyoseonensis]